MSSTYIVSTGPTSRNSFFLSVFHSVSNFQGDAARRREALYDVARLLLMAPIDPWQNSTPVFGALAICETKIDNLEDNLKTENEHNLKS